MATYTEAFGGTLGSWTSDSGTWAIVSGEVRQTASANYRKLRYTAAAMDSTNVASQAVCRSGDANIGTGVFVRGDASSTVTYYGLVLFPTFGVYIVEITAGSEQILASYETSPPGTGTNTTLRLEAEGSTLRGYVNGTLRMTVSDASLTGAGVGLMCYGGQSNTTTAYMDDWTAYDLVTGVNYAPTASIAATSTTPNTVGLAVARSLGASIAATSTTPNTVSLSIGGTFSASFAATSTTPNTVGLTVARSLGASISATSTTPNTVNLALGHALSASIAATSTTTGASDYGLRFYGWADDREDRVIIPLQGEPSNIGAGDFTLEWTMQCAYADNDNTASDVRYSNILIDHDVWGQPQGWCVGITRASGESRLIFGSAASSWAAITGSTHVGDGVVHRCALTRNGTSGQVRLWVDGAIDATGTFDAGDWSIPGGAPPGSGQDNYSLVLGCEKHDYVPGDGGYNGLLDELRISDTVRYTSTYTPTARLDVDGDTVALYHMDEGTGTTIVDAAGLSASGALLVGGSPTGPVWVGSAGGDVELTVARALSAGISATSTTPDTVSLSVARALLAAISATSTTPDIALTLETLIALTANIAASSTTPDVALSVARSLTAGIAGASTTPDAALNVARALLAAIAATSTTPTINLTLTGVIDLTASIAAASTTPDVALLVARTLTAGIAGASTTPDVLLSIARPLAAAISAASTTPTVSLTVDRGLTAGIAGTSSTPDVALQVARSLIAAINASSTTPDITLSTGVVIMGLLLWLATGRSAGLTAVGNSASLDAIGLSAAVNAAGNNGGN